MHSNTDVYEGGRTSVQLLPQVHDELQLQQQQV
jgi:hypothetical protein